MLPGLGEELTWCCVHYTRYQKAAKDTQEQLKSVAAATKEQEKVISALDDKARAAERIAEREHKQKVCTPYGVSVR